MPQQNVLLLPSLTLLFTRSVCCIVFYFNKIVFYMVPFFLFLQNRLGSSENQTALPGKVVLGTKPTLRTRAALGEIGNVGVPRQTLKKVTFYILGQLHNAQVSRYPVSSTKIRCFIFILQDAKAEPTKVVERKASTRLATVPEVQQPPKVISPVKLEVQVRFLGQRARIWLLVISL